MNRLPLPGARLLPRNKFTVPIVDGLPGYGDALTEAEAIGDYLTTLPIVSTTPPTPGPVDDDWQRAEDDRTAADERRERWRQRALGRQQTAIRTANAILVNAVDEILNALHMRLVDVLLTAIPDLKTLAAADVNNANDAIETGLHEEWSRLARTTWPDYRMLRDSQEFLMLNIAPDTIWRSAHPDGFDDEEPASLLWIRNLPDLWPDWRNRGRTRPEYRIDGNTSRAEPWAKPHGPEFLNWAFKAGAEHWIPDTAQFRELFAERRQQVNDDRQLQATAANRGESDKRPRPFKGHPPPIVN